MSGEAEEFIERLSDAIQEWAKHHPSPNTHRYPDGHRLLSARQLADEVANRTEYGMQYLHKMERKASSEWGPGYDSFIESINEITELFFKPRTQA